jgi:tetratricopeptide (TPR) repeat protein
MKPRISKYLIFALLLLIWVTTISYHIEQNFPVEKISMARILYLPSGKYIKLFSFGYPELTADFLYIWSIQFVGDSSIVDRYDYLENIYNVITDINPKFIDAYRIAALIAYYEMENLDVVKKFCEKGIINLPKDWYLSVDCGYYFSKEGMHDDAIRYFWHATKVPNSPTWTWRWVAAENKRKGDKKAALELWKLALTKAKTKTEKRICEGHIHDLLIEIELDKVQEAVSIFSSFHYRYPLSLSELVEAGYFDKIPTDPFGNPFLYDSKTGKVSPSTPFSIYHHIK